jgi:starch synthase
LKILYASSEVAPFAKTGGLADVAGALPKALAALGHDVRIVLPRYRGIDRERHGLVCRAEGVVVPIGDRTAPMAVFEGRSPGLPVYFLDQPRYYDREALYQTAQGDFPDNAERFLFFCRAVLEACKAVRFRPDLVHCNDWQTAMVPLYLKILYRDDPFFQRTASLLTIHNLGYQGLFGPETLPLTGLGWEHFTPEGIEYYGKVNLLKGGLLYADLLNTVSPTYAKEILTPEYGFGLEGVLRMRGGDLHGILNGLDPYEWDPAHDPALLEPFDTTRLEGKALNKRALQLELRLPEIDVPLLGMVTRLSSQKGLDLLMEAFPRLMDLDLQFVLLGSGEEEYHRFFKAMAEKYPRKTGIILGFDAQLARRVYAGSDAFLMPSRYEPCGLSQLIALRYGTVPIVRKTGGLTDTVRPYSPKTGPKTGKATGFLFREQTPKAFLGVVRQALAVYQDRAAWRQLQRQGMIQDFTWSAAARAYLRLYRKARRKLKMEN